MHRTLTLLFGLIVMVIAIAVTWWQGGAEADRPLCSAPGLTMNEEGVESLVTSPPVESVRWVVPPDPPLHSSASARLAVAGLFEESHRRVVSGRVVDPEGKPIEGASISARENFSRWQSEDEIFHISQGELDTAWTDADGRFALSTRKIRQPGIDELFTAPAFDLIASHSRYRPSARTTVAANDHDVLIALRPEGGIEGRVLFDPEVPPRRLSAELHRADATIRSVRVGSDGEFSFPALDPGHYSVQLVLDPRGEIVASADGFFISAKRAYAGPNRCTLDVRGRLRHLEFTVLDPDGNPVPEFEARWAPIDDSDQRRHIDRGVDGRLRILTAADAVKLRVRAAGHGTYVGDRLTSDHRLTLPGSVGVSLQLVDPACLPAYPYRLVARLYPSMAALDSRPTDLELSGEDPASARIFETGYFIVHLFVERPVDGRARRERIATYHERIVVPDDPDHRPYPVQLSPAAVQAAIDRFEDNW